MDNEFQKDHELQLYIKGKQDTFEYAFTTLAFTSLALSFQFSPPMGTKLPWFLVVSWILFFLSALCGGYRLMIGPQFDKINRARLILKKFVENRQLHLKDPAFLYWLSVGNMIDPETGRPHTLEGLQAAVQEEKTKFSIATENLEKLDKKTPRIFRLQVGSFLLGMLFNGFFVAVNYLGKN